MSKEPGKEIVMREGSVQLVVPPAKSSNGQSLGDGLRVLVFFDEETGAADVVAIGTARITPKALRQLADKVSTIRIGFIGSDR